MELKEDELIKAYPQFGDIPCECKNEETCARCSLAYYLIKDNNKLTKEEMADLEDSVIRGFASGNGILFGIPVEQYRCGVEGLIKATARALGKW